jgi:hypothetical protein
MNRCPHCGQPIRTKRLTRQEWRIFCLLGKQRRYGKRRLQSIDAKRRTKALAETMSLTERTIKAHAQGLYVKLQLDENRDRRVLAGLYYNYELFQIGLRALHMLPSD